MTTFPGVFLPKHSPMTLTGWFLPELVMSKVNLVLCFQRRV
jgi:hypothetical protein